MKRITILCLLLLNCLQTHAKNYVDYHRKVAEAITLCMDGQYIAARRVLTAQLETYQPFAEEYVLAAHIADKCGDTAAMQAYLLKVYHSNLDTRFITNSRLQPFLRRLNATPSRFESSPLFASIFEVDQRVRASGISAEDRATEDSIRALVRQHIMAGTLPGEREVKKMGSLSSHRVLLAHFPEQEIGWYDSMYIVMVQQGVLRPATVAQIMDYRGHDEAYGFRYYYGYLNDIKAAKLKSMKLKGKLPDISQHTAQVIEKRNRIGLTDPATNTRIIKYLDANGILLY